MANTLRRPIVVFVADDQPIENSGIFVPFCWHDAMCLKEPILLGYDGKMFYPLIPVDSQEQNIRVPLVDNQYRLLPVRPLRLDQQNDFSNDYELVKRYMSDETLQWERRHFVDNRKLEVLNTHIICALIQTKICRKDIYDHGNAVTTSKYIHPEKLSFELGDSLYTNITSSRDATSQNSLPLTDMDLDERLQGEDDNNNYLPEAMGIDPDETVPHLYEQGVCVKTGRLGAERCGYNMEIPYDFSGSNVDARKFSNSYGNRQADSRFLNEPGSTQLYIPCASAGLSDYEGTKSKAVHVAIKDTYSDDGSLTRNRDISIPRGDGIHRYDDTQLNRVNSKVNSKWQTTPVHDDNKSNRQKDRVFESDGVMTKTDVTKLSPCMGWFGEEVNMCFKTIARKVVNTLNKYLDEDDDADDTD